MRLKFIEAAAQGNPALRALLMPQNELTLSSESLTVHLTPSAPRLFTTRPLFRGEEVLRRHVGQMVTDQPKDFATKDIVLQSARKYFFTQRRALFQTKKTLLCLNLMSIMLDESEGTAAVRNLLNRTKPSSLQVSEWPTQTLERASTPMMLQETSLVQTGYKSFCQDIERAFPRFTSLLPFSQLLATASRLIIPLRLPPHISELSAPLFICPLLSPLLVFDIPRAVIQGEYVPVQRSFYLKVVTDSPVPAEQALAFRHFLKGPECLWRYGIPRFNSIRLSLDFTDHIHLAAQQFALKRKLLQDSILSVEVSPEGINQADLVLLRIYCFSDEDASKLPAVTKEAFSKPVSPQNEAAVKAILRQSCDFISKLQLPRMPKQPSPADRLLLNCSEAEQRIARLFKEKILSGK